MPGPSIIADTADVARRVPDGATLAISGSGGGLLEPDAILAALERSFLATGRPRDLTVVHALGIGDGRVTGLNRLAHEGMVRRVVGGHWSWSPGMQRLARENRIEAYSLPAGVISTLMRESGAGRPGVITRIGLGTFVDPLLDGGRCNARARDTLVERVEIAGETFLRYKPLKIDVGIVRGSHVDARGNLSLASEPADLDVYAVALAAHNTGGRVIAQVRERRDGPTLPLRLTRVPGILIDAVLVAPDQRQCAAFDYEPRLSGEARGGAGVFTPALPTGIRRIVAERAMRELGAARSVNFGYGIPAGIPALLRHFGRADTWGTVEQGLHNGDMLDGPMFGAALDADAIVSSVDQFDFYAGGGIDAAFLGMGEMDGGGDVNVSRLGDDIVGPGGFIDITQSARKVVFCGAFEARGLAVDRMADGALRILSPGAQRKLVDRVRHVTFSGAQARANGQEVLYVTERAVFRLGSDGVELVEIADGVDLQRDVLGRMGFVPRLRVGAPLPAGG
ncbi:MAG TPA: CoA-transferase [Methylomirabilota bacterium]|nr:CoA-transferase [Methylomirabilota bacterium]